MGIDVKLLPNGNLLHTSSFGSMLKETNWEGETAREYDVATHGIRADYDQIKLANGNTLSKVLRLLEDEQLDSLGFDINRFRFSKFSDGIAEFDPDGQLVWEWNVMDHVIQQRNPNKGNYGVILEHPELINMGARPSTTRDEIFMINGFDYNEDLDQIVISVRLFSEVIIIDHSTTKEEAKGHTGGNLGIGGDIAYRWGNPENYERGSEDDRFLYLQHNPNWIKYGEHKGKLIVFNNGLERPGLDYTNIPIISPPKDIDGNYILDGVQAYGPDAPDVIINEQNDLNIDSDYLSSAEVLYNGNILVSVGDVGRIIEFNPDLEVVWEYYVPNGTPFRSYKYPLDYPALDGRDLTPMGTLPYDNSTYDCELFTVSSSNIPVGSVKCLLSSTNTLQISSTTSQTFHYAIYNLHGAKMIENENVLNEDNVRLDQLLNGVYFLKYAEENGATGVFKLVLTR